MTLRMCDEKHEQRINLKFLVLLGKTPTECYKLLKEVYGENSLSRARVFEWCKRFFHGRESINDDQRPGRPVSISTPQMVTKINEIVHGDHRISIRMIAETVNADKETVRKILHEELKMKKVCGKWVPKKLTPDLKFVRQEMCSYLLERLNEEPELMANIITCDVVSLFQYDIQTKRQSMDLKAPASPRMKKAKMSKFEFKVTFIVFFDIKGIVMTEWVLEDKTVTHTDSLKVLATFQKQVRVKRPEIWKNKTWFLHHNNALTHTLSVKRYLATGSIPILKHPSYSPDLAPSDYFLYPKIKSALKGTRFKTTEEMKQKSAELLNTLTKEDFQYCFTQWKKRMEQCVAMKGEFVEGDHQL